ncbi:hypothetical protein [Marinobacter zhejiangensis]|uniref:Uncharacterized protein n=1 Tax=Marinobacter zhejiangensis TaxID=488535 RepID=A0A1I4LM28_9GAMM|nr:hypothetical protein [Marinobacter zhejiangensis]SFL91883.1 hypothetical protein SAMN04487963_0543 [Marinobacter zhejiangensis]
MKRILLVVVVTLVAGLGLAYYKVTSSVKEGLDNANAAMAMMGARLIYEGVSIAPNGDLQVSGLTFLSPTGDKLSIDQVALGTGNPLDLLNFTSQVEQRQIPEKLHVRIDGMAVDLDTLLGESGNPAEQGQNDNPLRHFEAIGCGDQRFFSVQDWKAMGYTEMRWNVDFDYRLDQGGARLFLNGNLESEDQGAIHLDTVFSQSLTVNHLTFSPELVESVRLVSARISYRDDGYMMRTRDFCARKTGLDSAAYRDHHLAAWRNVWTNKLALLPSDNVHSVYEDYIDNPGNTITLEIEPYPPLDMDDNYLSSNPEYLTQRLNPKIGSDNQPLAAFTVATAEHSENAETTATANNPSDREATPAPAAASTGPAAITVSTLNQHLNKTVVLTLTDGRILDGRIQSVSGGNLQLRRHLYGGVMDVPVELRTIRAVRLQ